MQDYNAGQQSFQFTVRARLGRHCFKAFVKRSAVFVGGSDSPLPCAPLRWQ